MQEDFRVFAFSLLFLGGGGLGLCGSGGPIGVFEKIEFLGQLPKGPYHTKNTTERESRYGEKIRCGRSKTLRRGLRNACFSRQNRQENGTESEKLRR